MKPPRNFNIMIFIQIVIGAIVMLSTNLAESCESNRVFMLEEIKSNRDNSAIISNLLPIVKCSFTPTKYEEILMTRLRDKQTTIKQFREITKKIAGLLVFKMIESMPVVTCRIQTPVTECTGIILTDSVDFVSVMRSGDALLDSFLEHFPQASVSKILIQRDEITAEPHFKYMKLSPSIGENSHVVITEPMIATGGTLGMVIDLLKEKGVKEENILIASICAAPEGLLVLNNNYPNISIVMTVMDSCLNEKKYIVPGLGDFGDRYYGTIQ